MHATTSTPRRLVRAALAAAALSLVAACGNGIGDAFDGDTAATVGDTRVDRDTVLDAVDRGLAGTTELKRQKLTEEHLTTQVRLILYRAEAAKLGITVTDEEKKTLRAAFEEQTQPLGGLDKAAETSGISVQDIPDILELFALQQELSAKLGADNPVTDADVAKLREQNPQDFIEQSQVSHILVKDEALAKTILAEIQAGGDFAALAMKHSLDGTKERGGDLGAAPRGQYVPEFDTAIYAAKPGDIVGPVKTQFGFHVIKVDRLLTAADIDKRARASLGEGRGLELLKERVRGGTPVEINSRFGKWNKATLNVVPVEAGSDAPSSPSATPSLRQQQPRQQQQQPQQPQQQ